LGSALRVGLTDTFSTKVFLGFLGTPKSEKHATRFKVSNRTLPVVQNAAAVVGVYCRKISDPFTFAPQTEEVYKRLIIN